MFVSYYFSSLGYGVSRISVLDSNLCSGSAWGGSADVVDSSKETNFIVNITTPPEIVAEEHTGWNYSVVHQEVGYICEDEGKLSVAEKFKRDH